MMQGFQTAKTYISIQPKAVNNDFLKSWDILLTQKHEQKLSNISVP